MPSTSQGATIIWGSSGFSPNIKKITPQEITLKEINTTHLGTTGTETAMLATLKSRLKVNVTCEWDDTNLPTIGAIAGVTEIRYADGGTITGVTEKAAIVGFTPPEADADNEDELVYTITLAFLEGVTVAAGT